jgi:XTP/dITP diphosphohydrolase
MIFLTGNKNKVEEAQLILGDSIKITNKKIDLPEIQSTSVEEVIKEKLNAAYKIVKKPVFCEDTGIYIKNMNNFPGALIKFYLDHIGTKGIAKFNGGSSAYAETVIGFHDGKNVHFFKGRINGSIAKKPKGKGFGWDPIFIPKNYNKTFGELTQEEKNKISMRAKAFKKFKKHFQ